MAKKQTAHRSSLAEQCFAYTLFTLGIVLGVFLGGFASLGFLP